MNYIVKRLTISLLVAALSLILSSITYIGLASNSITQEPLQVLEVAILVSVFAGILGWSRGLVRGVTGAIVLTVLLACLPVPLGEPNIGPVLPVLIMAGILLLLEFRLSSLVRYLGVLSLLVISIFFSVNHFLILVFVILGIVSIKHIAGMVEIGYTEVVRHMKQSSKAILSYLSISLTTVLYFAIFYRAIYLYMGSDHIGVTLTNGSIGSLTISSLFYFVYNSILIFTTVGPSFTAKSWIARLAVSMELVVSVSLLGVYFNLILSND